MTVDDQFKPDGRPDEAREPRRRNSEHGEAARSSNTRQTDAACPSPLELAAYIDGRADEALAERIEVHLARCAMCLELVRAIRLAKDDDSLPFVPPSVL